MAHSKLSTLEEWVLLIRAVIFVVRVDGDITIPTSPSERYVKLSPHTAPLYFNPCLWIRVLIVSSKVMKTFLRYEESWRLRLPQ